MNDLTVNKNAPTDDGEGGLDFDTLLGSYAPAPINIINSNGTLAMLAQLIGDGNLRMITHDIANKPTGNTVAAVLRDANNVATNLACYTPSAPDDQPPLLLHDYIGGGYAAGDGEICLAFDDITTAANVWANQTDMDKYSIIAPAHPRQFKSIVLDHAKKRQITVIADTAQAEQYAQDFKGKNVRVFAIADPLEFYMHYDRNLSDTNGDIEKILALDDTQELTIDEWGEPEPLDDDPSQPTRYPIEAWQGVLRDAVEAIAYHAQVPTAMAGQCVLGALSTIGQRFINAPIGHTHKPAALFLITEGESGSGKTFASSLSHRSIKQWDKTAYLSFIEQLDEWQGDLDTLKGKERREYLQDNPRPTNKAMLLQDSTIEAALDRFILNEMPNLSWTTDEAAQFFSGYSLKSETKGNALGSLTKLWSDGEAQRSRSQRGANPQYKTNAYDVRLTLDLQGQRVILEPALTDPLLLGQGFLARALLACPDSLQGKRVWNTPERMNQSPDDDPRLQAYWARCDILLDPPPSNINTDITGKEMRHNMPFANQQARQALADFQQRIENRQAKGGIYEYLKAFAGRMAENASRIASLMAFFDCQKSVSADYLERAFMLVEYSTAERLRYIDIGTGEQSNAQKLIDWIIKKAKAKKTDRLNWSFIYNNAPYGLQKNTKLLKEVLGSLESSHHIQEHKNGKATIYEINPKLLL